MVQPVGVPGLEQHSVLQQALRSLQQRLAASVDALIASPNNINAENISIRISEVDFFIFISMKTQLKVGLRSVAGRISPYHI